jgi:hypothetical protein
MFVEFLNSSNYEYTDPHSSDTGSGDSIYAYVNGSPSTEWWATVTDYTTSKTWSTGVSGVLMGKAHYADFEGEVPSDSPSQPLAALACREEVGTTVPTLGIPSVADGRRMMS